MQLRKEIKFETLHKSHKKKVIIGVVIICIVGSVLVFKTTRAKYRFTQSIPFVRGTINYKPYDFKMMAMYQQKDDVTCTEDSCYNELDIMPEYGYAINETKSYCTKDGTNKDTNVELYTDDRYQHVIKRLSKSEKCYLYFDRMQSVLLLKYTKSGTRPNYQTLETDNSGKVYSLADDDGTSYYFAGKVNDNWVSFAGFYWRIVRFNGDGTIRLIYSGTSEGKSGTNAQIGTIIYNSNNLNNMYVGYRYTDGDIHGYGNPSKIQGVIDTWYKTNIVDKGYGDKVDTNAGFCGDRDNYKDSNGTTAGGTETTSSFYGAYIRFYKGGNAVTSPTPTFKCKNSSDLYTISKSLKGNKSLTYPAGLITVDEVNAAGAIAGTRNTSYYLNTYQTYWTMSPSYYNGYAYVFYVGNVGNIEKAGIVNDYALGVRPVINLRADTEFKPGGDGTSTSPCEVA